MVLERIRRIPADEKNDGMCDDGIPKKDNFFSRDAYRRNDGFIEHAICTIKPSNGDLTGKFTGLMSAADMIRVPAGILNRPEL